MTGLMSRSAATARHATQYLESGPSDGPLMIFVHGWPSIGLMWRAQMDAFATKGWHCIAPDLRGFGGSSAPQDKAAYAIEAVVRDTRALSRQSSVSSRRVSFAGR